MESSDADAILAYIEREEEREHQWQEREAQRERQREEREAERERKREEREAKRERQREAREAEREQQRDTAMNAIWQILQEARTAHVSSIGERDFRAILDQEDVRGVLVRADDANNEVHGPTIEEDGDDQVGQNFTWRVGEVENEDAHIVEFYNRIRGAIQQSLPGDYHLYNVRASNAVNMELNIEDPHVSVRGRPDFVLTVGRPDQFLGLGMMGRSKLFIEAKPSLVFHAPASERQAVTELILGNKLSLNEVTVVLTSGDHWRFYKLDRIRNTVDGVETTEWWAMFEYIEGWAQGIARLRFLAHEQPAVNRFRLRAQLALQQRAAGGGANGGRANGGGANGGGLGAPAPANDDHHGADGGEGNVNRDIRGPVGGGGAGIIEAAADQPDYSESGGTEDDESVDLEWEYACAVAMVNRMPMFQGVH
jgi:sRNA-binding protein